MTELKKGDIVVCTGRRDVLVVGYGLSYQTHYALTQDEDRNHYRIVDDNGKDIHYSKDFFITLAEHRQNTIKEIINEHS